MARLFLLALILVPALAQGVRTGITPGEMEALLKAGSYRYERVEEGGRVYFHLRLAGLRAVLFLQDCREGSCESLLLYAGFSTDNPPSLERVNEWNREKRFSRADLDLAGGVADGAIRAFLDLFEENLRAFAAWIGWE